MSCKVYFRQLRRSMWATDDDAQHIEQTARVAIADDVYEWRHPWCGESLAHEAFDLAVRRYLHLRTHSTYADIIRTLDPPFRSFLQ